MLIMMMCCNVLAVARLMYPRIDYHRGHSCVYHNSHCDTKSWARVAHPYYSA